MHAIYFVYTHLLFASLILSLLLFGLLQKYRQNRISQGILWLSLVTIGVESSTLLSLYSPNAAWAVWWHGNVRLAIYTLIPPAGFLFVHAFVSRNDKIDKRLLWIFLIPLIMAAASLTNDWHHWYFGDYSMRFQEVYLRAAWQPHLLFWIHTIYAYAIGFAILGLLIFWFRRVGILPRLRGILMLSVAVLFSGSISLDTFGFILAPGAFFLPLSLGLINALLIFGIWYLDLLDILPVARETLTRYMSDAIFVVDAQNRVLDVNPEGEKLVGRPASEIVGRYILDFVVHKERVERARKILDGEFHGIMPLNVQGVGHFFDITITDITLENSVLAARLIVLRDVTELKQAEEALRESDTRYRLLAENIIDVIWILDLETQRFRYVSPSVERLQGFTVEEVLAQDMTAALPPVSLKKLQENLPGLYAEFLQGQHQYYVDQLEQLRKDGSTVWTETTTRFVRNPDNNHIEVYGVSRDITERKRVEDALRQSELTARTLLELPTAAIMLLSLDGRILDCNEILAQRLKVPIKGLIGNPAWQFISPQAAAERKQHFIEAVNTAQMVRWEDVRAGKWFDNLFVPITDQQGKVTKIIACGYDITARKLAEEQQNLRAAIDERQRLARDLHDAVSQTLFSARLTSEMLLRQKDTIQPGPLWANIAHFASLAKSALGEMRILLLELRPEGLENANLPTLLSHLVDAADGRTESEIRYDAQGQCDLPIDVKIAFYRIAQETLNNIIKHAQSAHVTIHLSCEQSQTQLVVQDDGLGFKPGENTGAQMGLSIMRERASQIGANLEITSSSDQGTRITCTWRP